MMLSRCRLGRTRLKVARCRVQRRLDEALGQPVGVGAAAVDQVAEALDQDAAAQHVGQRSDPLAILIRLTERRREFVADQQGEVGVLAAQGRIGVAVSVDRDDPVGVFCDDIAVRIHAEGPDRVLVQLGAVMQLGFIDGVGDLLEDDGRQFDPDPDVDLVVDQVAAQPAALLAEPLGAGAAGRDDQVAAGKFASVVSRRIAVVSPGG